jgi:hypothetical protein
MPANCTPKNEEINIVNAPGKCIDLGRLHARITDIDAASQEALARIKALACVTLDAMKAPDFWRSPEKCEGILSLIAYHADELRDTINLQAEEVGCDWKEPLDNDAARREYLASTEASHG